MIDVKSRMVVPGVLMVELEIGQVYIWDWGDGLTVIDSGIAGSAGAILAAIDGMGRQREDVREIVLTHYHDDHRGGAAELARHSGARIVAHRADATVIRGDTPQPPPNLTDFERPIAEGVLARMAPATSGEAAPGSVDLETLAQALVTSTLPPVPVDREVENGDTLAGGGVVIHVPGHTPGSIAVLAPDLGVTFTGDTLASHEGGVIPGVFNLDGAELHASIRKLARLEFGAACFGHGAPVVGEASRQIRALAESLPSVRT